MLNVSRVVDAINPLVDPRWPGFLSSHPRASGFHTAAWLRALERTYGFEPVAYVTSRPDGTIRSAIVFARVKSWITGRRLVSLPFSDACEPLIDEAEDWRATSAALEEQFRLHRLRYLEVRPVTACLISGSLYASGHEYCRHEIDLTADLDQLFANCHKSSTQRKIMRARREGLTYQEGRSEALLDIFYRLQVMTRRRHHIPPQPKRWFRNLIACCGEDLKIRVASKDEQPVASILTLRYQDVLYYKYGCSDEQFNSLGGMHLLFWLSIEEAKRDGLRVFDLGRSDLEGAGLITFKDRWGSTRSQLTNQRFSASSDSGANYGERGFDWRTQTARRVFSHLPDSISRVIGEVLYKHIG